MVRWNENYTLPVGWWLDILDLLSVEACLKWIASVGALMFWRETDPPASLLAIDWREGNTRRA